MYYPNYEVYYGRNHRQYVYRDGNAWVSRPVPAGVQVDMLLTSPSVRVNFHDPPARHHSAIARTYPRNWVQPALPESQAVATVGSGSTHFPCSRMRSTRRSTASPSGMLNFTGFFPT